MALSWLTSPDDPRYAELAAILRDGWSALDDPARWPAEQLAALGRYGVFAWFIPAEQGGLGWSEADCLRGLTKLARDCLTTTFVLTQRVAAVARIVAGDNDPLRRELLPRLLTAETFATIGISHLTTSRQHVAAVLEAQERDGGFLLKGYSPWVTGAAHAETLVIGATLPDERQLLAAVVTESAGVVVPPPEKLVALGASHTGRVEFHDVFVPRDRLLAEPKPHVLQQGLTIRTGGSQTSALAIGLTDRALEVLEEEAARRHGLVEPAEALRAEWLQLVSDMLDLAEQRAACTSEQLRQRANSLVLRASQAALAATKGAGFAAGHPAGRICREALFFLVWSCPQPVTTAHLCELAGI